MPKFSLKNLPKGMKHYPCGPARAALQKRQVRHQYAHDLMHQHLSETPQRHGFWWRLFCWFFVLGIWGVLFLVGLLAWYAVQLPRLDDIIAEKRTPSITFVDQDGRHLKAVGDLYGAVLQVDELPEHLIHAVLAIEDKRFYSHWGVDPFGILRAAWVNWRSGQRLQGGSTLTQQVAKNVFLSQSKTMKRKVQELMLAFWLEYKFTKNQILSLYLNRVYFGMGAYGIEAAAQRYFGKSARDVSLYEGALLAGLLKAPSYYNPLSSPELSRERTQLVLKTMVRAGFLSEKELKNVQSQPSTFREQSSSGKRYFVDWVIEELSSVLGDIDRDLIVHTTLHSSLQDFAEKQVLSTIQDDGVEQNLSQGALVLLDRSGAVYAMVGGKDYQSSQFNRSTQALRQPGSTFKPFVYLAALEDGYEPTDVMEDAPFTLDGWTPQNHDHLYSGDVTLQTALIKSLNTIPILLAQEIGLEKVLKVARRLGLVDEIRQDYSTVLGTSEVRLIDLTSAYGTLMNDGYGLWAYGILKIEDTQGNVLYDREGGGPGKLLDPEVVSQMNQMLASVLSDGTGRQAFFDVPACGKTGTSQDHRDAWFVGYTGDYVAGVWLGNDDNSPMKSIYGGTLPAQIWKAVMKKLYTQTQQEHALLGLEM